MILPIPYAYVCTSMREAEVKFLDFVRTHKNEIKKSTARPFIVYFLDGRQLHFISKSQFDDYWTFGRIYKLWGKEDIYYGKYMVRLNAEIVRGESNDKTEID